ncbi:MAG: ATP-binding protein, partial [Staphylococcus equorum]|nr:ATP-binding protein [Staphylococcus equorum]
ICGVSGAGKSVFSLEILAAYKSLGYKIYILDVGRSFKNFVALSKGQTIDFAKRERICMNPFSWLEVVGEDEDTDGDFTLNTFAQEMKMLLPMYAKMASPETPLDAYEKALMSKAIKHTWEQYGQKNGVDQISDYLKTIKDHTGQIDPVGWRLGTQLENFKSGGMYGAYFNGEANIDLNNDTIYLELEELKDSPELKTVVLFGVTNRIMRDMYLSRKQGKVMFIDEAWQLLDDTAETAAFIEEGYRRARKYNGSFGMGTQGIDDAFKNDAARAAYNSADWKFYLRQDLESFEKLISEKKANFTDNIAHQIRSLDTQGGMYSEVMVTSPNGKHIVRHIADPFSLAMASTNADDYVYIEDCISKGMTTVEAVYALMALKEEAA